MTLHKKNITSKHVILLKSWDAYTLSCLIQVAIEYGLCEILNTLAIKSEVAPKDKKFDFKISDLEAMFPEGMVDHNVDMIYKEVLYITLFPSFLSLLFWFFSVTINLDLYIPWFLVGFVLVATMGRICGKLQESIC